MFYRASNRTHGATDLALGVTFITYGIIVEVLLFKYLWKKRIIVVRKNNYGISASIRARHDRYVQEEKPSFVMLQNYDSARYVNLHIISSFLENAPLLFNQSFL